MDMVIGIGVAHVDARLGIIASTFGAALPALDLYSRHPHLPVWADIWPAGPPALAIGWLLPASPSAVSRRNKLLSFSAPKLLTAGYWLLVSAEGKRQRRRKRAFPFSQFRAFHLTLTVRRNSTRLARRECGPSCRRLRVPRCGS